MSSAIRYRYAQLALVSLLPVALLGPLSARAVVIHEHDDHGEHVHVVERSAIFDISAAAHRHQETPHHSSDSRGPDDGHAIDGEASVILFLNGEPLPNIVNGGGSTGLKALLAVFVVKAFSPVQADANALPSPFLNENRPGGEIPCAHIPALLLSSHALLI